MRFLMSGLVFVLLLVSPAWADVAHVSIDISSLAMQDIEMEFALYDNSGTVGDSWAFIDNIMLGGSLVAGFEAGALAPVNGSLNAASVNVVPGSIGGSGAFVMRMDEDPAVTPTFAILDLSGSAATTLEFDLDFTGSATPGFFGLDQFVLSLLNPDSLDPLLPGLTPGFGDLFTADANGFQTGAGVTVSSGVTPVPAPGALVLATLGLGCIRFARRMLA